MYSQSEVAILRRLLAGNFNTHILISLLPYLSFFFCFFFAVLFCSFLSLIFVTHFPVKLVTPFNRTHLQSPLFNYLPSLPARKDLKRFASVTVCVCVLRHLRAIRITAFHSCVSNRNAQEFLRGKYAAYCHVICGNQIFLNLKLFPFISRCLYVQFPAILMYSLPQYIHTTMRQKTMLQKKSNNVTRSLSHEV